MDLNLQQWFDQDSHYQRVAKTYSPDHADEGVGQIGEELGSATGGQKLPIIPSPMPEREGSSATRRGDTTALVAGAVALAGMSFLAVRRRRR